MISRGWGAARASSAVAVMAALSACGGKVVFTPTGGEGGAGSSPSGPSGTGSAATSGGAKPDLYPVCKKFCGAYQHCAPVTDCMNGCLISAFHGCENEYVADVECITGALVGCNFPQDKCVTEGQSYEACQMMQTSGGGQGGAGG